MKNLNVLILVAVTYPDTSPTSTLSINFANQLRTMGHNIDFACIKYGKEPEYTELNGYKIVRFEPSWSVTLNVKYQVGIKRKKLPFFVRAKYNLSYIMRKRFGIFVNDVLKFCNYKDIKKAIQTNLSKKYDLIISFNDPFGIHVIASKLKKYGMTKKVFAVMLDTYEYNATRNKTEIPQKIKNAKKTFANIDKIFMVDGILAESLSNNYNPSYHNKTIQIHQTMLVDNTDKKALKAEVYNMIYAGLFYEDIRNPKEMLQVMAKLPKEFCFNIYSKNCEEVVENAKPLFKDCKLNANGLIMHEECIKKIRDSHILVNLSNVNTTQLPTKILEYIGYGKPIINFYFTKEDTGSKILKRYPLVFNFNLTNYTEKDIQDLILFCQENKDKTISFEEATKNLEEFKIENICKTVLNEY